MPFSLKAISLAILLFLENLVLFCMGAAILGHDIGVVVKSGGDCLGGGERMWEEEMEMEMETDSETNRRMLAAQKKYISYESLKKDEVPCSRPGASYYNCNDLAKSHPYTRGCAVITGCARGTRS